MVCYKQMKYQGIRESKVLCKGTYYGFNYFILSLGTHPTAYIELKKPMEFTDEDEIFFPVHGGITYHKSYLHTEKETLAENSDVIGWDYAHLGDCFGEPNGFDEEFTTYEILLDVFHAIMELKRLNE